MKAIVSTLILMLLANILFAQTLYTRTDTIQITNDSITIQADEFRGALQWQSSSDSINWDNLLNQNNQTLKRSKYAEGTYRAEITDGTCNPVYSDTASIKSELPVLVTDSVTAITDSSAIIYGTIVTDGGALISAKGVCWNNTGNPALVDSVVYSNIDSSKFNCLISGLNYNTTYFVNAFASNSNGTVYGEPIEFKTEKLKFSVTQYVEANIGSTINTPDGSSLLIPAGALQANGNVTIASVVETDQPNIPNKNLMIFGNPYTINLPSNSVNENLTFSFTLETIPEQLECYVPYLYKNNSFYPIEYSLNGKTVTAIIDKLSWQDYRSLESEKSSSLKSISLVGEAITIVSLIAIQAPPARQMGIKKVDLSNGDMFFADPSLVSDTSKILLLIHGWTDKPETWTNFIQKIKLQSDIKFDNIWTFGYNSSLGIDENGAKLSGGLATYTHGAKVKIVAHSMGGLVARSMIENYGGSIYVKKLITLGTPHHGSPLGAIRDLLGAVITIEAALPATSEFCVPGTSEIYNYKTQGFQDLAENSDFIADMETTLTSPLPYCCIAGINLPTDNILIQGQDDFVVGLSSAICAPTPASTSMVDITCSFPDFAHNKLLTNADVYFKTIEFLNDSYTLKIIQGDNQEGKPGEKLSLPIIIQVLDEIDNPVKNEQVYFESEYYPGNYSGLTTREDGKVAVAWTLDDVEGTQKIQVYLKDDSGNKIDESAITITAEGKIKTPSITTNSITNITETSAFGGGNITDDGGATVTSRGVCWNTTGSPTINNSITTNSNGTGSFSSSLTNLSAGTTYYVRAYATNSKGTGYGNQVSFTTTSNITLPTVTTSAVSNITETTATCGGNVSDDGGANITSRGVCWNTTGNPTTSNSKTSNGSGTGSFISLITGLTANITYYVRVYATNSKGTSYGEQVSFIAKCNCDEKFEYFTDSRDGHVYKTIQIGSQTWMAENLAYLPYTTPTSIYSYTDPCYYIYDYSKYGVLYNWPAAINACPSGWHLPSNAEWSTLSVYLGGESVAGSKMKSVTGWVSNISTTNESCFSAIAGGFFRSDLGLYSIGIRGYWKSSNTCGEVSAWEFGLKYDESESTMGCGSRTFGSSVRCVRD